MNNALTLVYNSLKQLSDKVENKTVYKIPALWDDPFTKNPKKTVDVNPFEFFTRKIDEIKKLSVSGARLLPNKNWSKQAIVYNMLVRLTTSFDHNNDGEINISVGKIGLRETGTFLKSIALLPYIHSLGVNTVYMLPITSIGIDAKKGSLGSPYAIKNPYKLDENLSEPALGLDVETQARAFIDSAHLLGMKVIVEFVFRTASVDSDLAFEHPEWFYWLKADIKNRPAGSANPKFYGPPVFTAKELKKIKDNVEKGQLDSLLPPHKEYLDMFTKVPVKIYYEKSKVRGETKDKTIVKIPGAFADWPPNDSQPVWSDVTYLKLYDSPDFNYIAYNTVRMYDAGLKKSKYIVKSLWDSIINIIPHYQHNFKIDGVMIDMGHALPSELRSALVEKAREKHKGFVFWEENFNVTQKSVDDGYDAVLGYMPFDMHDSNKVKALLALFATEGFPLPFFLTPESHNTPRAASKPGKNRHSMVCWAINNFIPGITFISSGFELGEDFPVNTGLCFEPEEIKLYPAEKLPLFSHSSLSWTGGNEINMFMRKVIDIRNALIPQNSENYDPNSIRLLDTPDDVIAFLRIFDHGKKKILVCCNVHPKNKNMVYINLGFPVNYIDNMMGEHKINGGENGAELTLNPYEVVIGVVE